MALGIDVKVPLTYSNTDKYFRMTKSLKETYKQHVKMLLLTSPGERIMLANYGVGLKHFLFENTPEVDIIQRIYDQVALFLPQITIVNLNVRKDANALSVIFSYAINGTSLTDSVAVTQSRQF